MGTKPLLLDLFCGAGGASMGYHRAGFKVIGIDSKAQPNYPFEFVRGDALNPPVDLSKFDAIHASPPCQAYSSLCKGQWKDRKHPDLVASVRALLRVTNKPYIIENVAGAPLESAIMLCGTMFELQTKDGAQLRRHRYFECSLPINVEASCAHNNGSAIGVYGGGQHPARRRPATIGVWGHSGGSSKRDGLLQFGVAARREAMGITWMKGHELSQAIPPAYTEHIGKQLMRHLGH